MLLVDLASYQEGIDLAKVKAAGFSAINIKLTQGNWYRWARGAYYADVARNLGMGISTFAWVDNSAPGAEQAAYAYKQMQALGGPDGMAHQCDCEDSSRPASYQIWRDYVSWWQDKLGRRIANYTGDWWWQPRGWDGASLTPYLWAAPNNGYLNEYPGDGSDQWHAGYGGWGDYSLLQYAVQPIPGAGGGNLSMTAIRDPQVWAELTGGDDMALTNDDIKRFWEYLVPNPGAGGQLTFMKDFSIYGNNVAWANSAKLDALAAADETRDKATLAAIQALAAGDASVDTSAVVNAVNAVRDEARAQFAALHDQIAAKDAAIAQLQAKLAAAAKAEADALATS